MERIVEQNLLYDFYGELLTAHQKEIYGEHILNDMTATEIAAEFGITRQAVHDMIRRCDKILADYEARLHLVAKFLTRRSKRSIPYPEGFLKKIKSRWKKISDK